MMLRAEFSRQRNSTLYLLVTLLPRCLYFHCDRDSDDPVLH